MTFTDEDMQEFDAAQREAAGEPHPDADTREPDVAPDDEYADMSIDERNMWLDEYAAEDEAERRAMAALYGPDAYWR